MDSEIKQMCQHKITTVMLGPVPKVAGDGVMDLADIIGADGVNEIQRLGEIRLHALGDSGVGHAEDAEKVADDMATDYKPGAGSLNPAFLFHLGDVIMVRASRSTTANASTGRIATIPARPSLFRATTMARQSPPPTSHR
jgi:hypothetical protein